MYVVEKPASRKSVCIQLNSWTGQLADMGFAQVSYISGNPGKMCNFAKFPGNCMTLFNCFVISVTNIFYVKRIKYFLSTEM